MKVALLSAALLAGQPVTPVSDRVPHLNVEVLCKATVADDKANGVVLGQSLQECMSDETDAQQQLSALWTANAGPVRDRCEAEATSVPYAQSYVDLLSCIQAAESANPRPSAPLKGASKNRNAK
ncbi:MULTISPECIES: hypothetical protein [Bradyrhizobium]|uniref:Uncharacterized protein n=1 Tax=Bradyrhizobium arachidis TaxID=858423 RepID=A0AAE7NFY1_9BRAD|nr:MULTISPECIES: hypothetical protein [Bradyrhizobium]QOG21113.1 hypothetical protein FOM02_31155 [Bradyrhizobium sp. SEMIA]QOZ65414.1 hypothetical protein WN72_02310 [Bradyrhizobium arachidis]UFW49943.1 hypothetical protein BaraCB756_02325 [Bradyrhizobium arachidis]SFV15178.1 hypothetical protein SAMN05192541_12311 [Bradyrhizobium arachidis]